MSSVKRRVSDNRNKGNGPRSQSWKMNFLRTDTELTTWIAVCASPTSRYGIFRPLMKLLELSGHGLFWLSGVVAAVFLSHDALLHQVLLNLILGLLLDLLVSFILKASIRRNRPAHNEMDMFGTVSVDHYSFPSGHATRMGLLAVFFCYHFDLGTVGTCLFVSWTVAVAVSRLMLGRHYVSDVLSGYTIGLLQYRMLLWLWLTESQCEKIISFIEEDFHL